MKRFLTIFLILGSLLLILTAGIYAEDATAPVGTCGENLTWTIIEDGCLVISGTGDMYDWGFQPSTEFEGAFVRVNPPWSEYSAQIVTVMIAEGVTSIGDYAFDAFHLLQNVLLPDSLLCIGSHAFSSCPEIHSILFPDGLAEIEPMAFYGCTGLSQVRIPRGVTAIGDYTFYDCSSLAGVYLPENITEIGQYAFSGCRSMTCLYYDGSQTQWDAITKGEQALPSRITPLLRGVGGGMCGTAVAWTVADGVLTISGTGNMAYSFGVSDEQNTAPWHPYAEEITTIVIEEGVTSIRNRAFSWMTNVTSVSIPEGLLSIETKAFFHCEKIISIEIPDTVMQLGDGVFACCYSLESINIPSRIPVIGTQTFYQCENLRQIELPASLTSIGDYAFSGCDALTEITVSSSVANIGTHAFGYGINEENTDGGKAYKIDGFTVYGTSGSAAEEYANEHGFLFQDLKSSLGMPFTDISLDSFYYDAVQWASSNSITSGVSSTHFDPDVLCTRSQVITFLWRTQSCPEPTITEAPYTDLDYSSWYIKAALWAHETGVTSGVGGGKFGPEDAMTRSQLVTLLWRLAGSLPAENAQNSFVDVPDGTWYTEAVLWAVEQGITQGTGGGRFEPDTPCNRAVSVTFLYRYVQTLS